jgi:GT2 family glycosyltransferase
VTLSIVIVNYNVKDLLEQCLNSVKKAIAGISAEVFIVDNASTDGSLEFLLPEFPDFVFIKNDFNQGFAKANNQALRLVKGRYVLFLNPDTVVPSNCFKKCIEFFQTTPDAGALGVKMINGAGEFLRESKRGFPSPLTSFWKMTGLTGLFPRSPIFSKYYMGRLEENKDHAVDVLSGAFMMVKKEVLDKTGGFDERFFMYAEDIDLSYRIIKSGHKNYYFAGTTIVHYKGGSTKKDIKYIRQFYLAMSQFVRKYYGRGVYSFFLDIAIWLRAGIDVLRSYTSSHNRGK